MPSLKDLKVRIKSVKSTQKIMKAMKVVAAAKLSRPYLMTMIIILGMTGSALAGQSIVGARYEPVAPKEFLELSKMDGAIILDVRDKADPKNVVMDGAVALPESDITKEKIEAIAPDKSKPLLLVCNYSFMERKEAFESRAMLPMSANQQAARKLMSLGYKKIYGLEYQPFGMGLSRLPLREVKKEQK